MDKIIDYSKIKLDSLSEIGLYDEELIGSLQRGDYGILNKLDNSKREDPDFMFPILYAMINDPNIDKSEAYSAYEFCGEKLKRALVNDYNLSCDIMLYQPELIIDSPLAVEKNIILQNVERNPDILKYVSPSLDEDQEFLSDLSKLNNREVIKEAISKFSAEKIISSNPALLKNEVFMREVIANDISSLKYADKEMLNNYDLFKYVAENNKDALRYTVENSEKLGLEAINGVKDGTLKVLTGEVINSFSEEEKQEKSVKRSVEFLESDKNDDLSKARAFSHALNKRETVSQEELEELFNFAEVLRIALERKIEENPEYVVSREDLKGLINHRELTRALDKSPLKDDEIWRKRVKEYNKFVQRIRREINKNKEKINEQSFNANLSVDVITLTVSRNGIEEVITYDKTQPEAIQLTDEQLRQLEADLKARSTKEEKDKTSSRGTAALNRNKQLNEKTL